MKKPPTAPAPPAPETTALAARAADMPAAPAAAADAARSTIASVAAGASGSADDPFRRLDAAVHAHLADAAMGLSPISLALAQADWLWHLAASPGRQMLLAQRAVELGWQAAQRCLQPRPEAAGGDHGGDGAEADPRFADAGWRHWPFLPLKEGFQAAEAWWREAAQVEGLSRHHRHMVEFFARQGLDAVSPSNGPATNPTVLQAGLDSAGQTWAKGWQRFLDDLARLPSRQPAARPGEGRLEPLPYAVGQDVAVTPGQVVFRNRLIELIRYTPTTPQVHPEPLLIVPSPIMKYYILDLSPGNSMVRYLVGEGFTVFMISWRNPDAGDRDLGMQDYLQLGVLDALATVGTQAAAPRVHALGYCLGGTFLAIVAAVLGRRQQQAAAAGLPQRRRDDTLQPRRRRGDSPPLQQLPQLATVTLLAAQSDFSEPGELGVFIDDDQLRTLQETMARTGYLSGRAMAGSFQFLNSRDLVWSRNIRRYLLGQDETGNDMMSWNADVTRLPARMHSEYLSSLFLNNALAAGHYRFGGEGVALMDIRAPMLVVGTVRDHVSPWRSVYKIHLLTDTDTCFVLVAGGHNAGIVSEPGHARRSYQIDSVARGHAWVDPDTWLAQAPRHEGSWWPAMSAWLKQHSSAPQRPPPLPRGHALGAAPGRYVHVRYAD